MGNKKKNNNKKKKNQKQAPKSRDESGFYQQREGVDGQNGEGKWEVQAGDAIGNI